MPIWWGVIDIAVTRNPTTILALLKRVEGECKLYSVKREAKLPTAFILRHFRLYQCRIPQGCSAATNAATAAFQRPMVALLCLMH